MQPTTKAYAISLAALIAAVLLRWLLDPLLGDTLPLVTLFGAVAIAAWVGGYIPATIVGTLGYLACNYLFIAPRHAAGPFDTPTLVGLVAYVFTCALIIGIGEAVRSAQQLPSPLRVQPCPPPPCQPQSSTPWDDPFHSPASWRARLPPRE